MAYALSVNGTALPTPTQYQFIVNDIDGKSTRNAAGKLTRDRVAVKRKLTIQWGPLSIEQLSQILTAIKEPFFQCTYLDGQEGKEVTKTFYVGDRTSPSYSWNENMKSMAWQSLSCDFIEQ
ncbi:DUF6711 family protein [Levilactobacillus bambusae]|uniref:Prophage protein n=1 Tax=Levilactobacillus bambusae TaxID=2024736 RepID=A0A2V1N1L1_9LACO|nr:DUF6711 family protein [Levilactobacillus bambusae]PWG00952.1 hypothetical protein DCM90_01890 [Levilactobacillus bambusae]